MLDPFGRMPLLARVAKRRNGDKLWESRQIGAKNFRSIRMIVTDGRARGNLRDSLKSHIAAIWNTVHKIASLRMIDGSRLNIRLRMRSIQMMIKSENAFDSSMTVVSKAQL